MKNKIKQWWLTIIHSENREPKEFPTNHFTLWKHGKIWQPNNGQIYINTELHS